jgi:large subunit ribosomal protein L4
MKLNVYSPKSAKAGEMPLPDIFKNDGHLTTLAQALRVYEDRKHMGNARVQTRGEVTRTTKKWFRQKGTGRARHGARSAPIFVGGGVAHGPKGIKRELKLSAKIRSKALNIAYYLKAKDNKIVVISDIKEIAKTKEAYALIAKLNSKEPKTIVLAPESWEKAKFFKNISNVMVEKFTDMNAYKAFVSGILVFDEAVFGKKEPKKVKKTTKIKTKK